MNNIKAKHNDMLFDLLRTIVAVGISLAIVIVIILLLSNKPFEALKHMILGPFSSLRRMGNVLELAIPLTFCGLALSLTFRANQYNMIADGAFLAGAMASFLIGHYVKAPAPIVIIAALLGGMITGAALGAIPAIMKLKLGAMELVSSLMLNYIITFVVLYILTNVVRDPNSMVLQSVNLPAGINLGKLLNGTRLHFGLLIVVVCVILTSVFLFKNKKGYALRMTASNQQFALFSGISVGSMIIGAQVLGAALAGLGGAVELLGVYDNFKWEASPGYRFDGVIIAILARNNPAMIPLAAIFLAYLRTGADILNRSVDIPYEIVSIVQAPIILFIASQAFLAHLKQRALVKQTI